MPQRRHGWLAIIALGTALGGCATAPPNTQYSSLPPAPRHPAPQPAVVKPVAPDLGTRTVARLPNGEYADLMDRLRAGYQLQDVQHYEVDRQVENYRSRPDFMDRTLLRSTRYLHHIVSELERRGLPMELALLPIVESAYNPVAYSRSRASGLWQFIPSTGKHYGLEQNWWLDERRDVLEATSAALDYLTYLNRYFQGDWLLAIAAYNGGEGAVGRAVKRSLDDGRPGDFFSLGLVTETREYVPRLLALKRLVGNPEAYGMQLASIPNEPYFTVVDPGRQFRLDDVAELAGVPKEEVLALNPAFNRMSTPPHGPYRLLLPVAQAPAFLQALNEGRTATVRVATTTQHEVRRGENLSSIARRYGTSTAALREANGLSGSTLLVGQNLTIPLDGQGAGAGLLVADARPDLSARQTEAQASAAPPKPRRHLVKPGESLWSVARLYGVTVPTLAAANGLTTRSQLSTGQSLQVPRAAGGTRLASSGAVESVRMTYKVRRGDTLSQIAERFDVSVRELMSWNNMKQATSLRAGRQLVLFVDPARVSGG